MNVEKAQSLIAAITSTLWDVSPTLPTPKSPIYLAMNCDWHSFELIMGIMVSADLLVVTPETVALTPKGRDIGRRCSEIYASARKGA